MHSFIQTLFKSTTVARPCISLAVILVISYRPSSDFSQLLLASQFVYVARWQNICELDDFEKPSLTGA